MESVAVGETFFANLTSKFFDLFGGWIVSTAPFALTAL